MKNFTIQKICGKATVLLLGLIMLVSMICLAGCETTTVEQPKNTGQVYSVNLQYDGANVDGQLTVDISLKNLVLSAKILQDGYETATYESSDPTVATISSNGIVNLISVGETIVTATAGNKSHSVILVVRDELTSSQSYALTVSGGVAKNASGEIVTAAKAGEYITLVPSMPAHKDFVAWSYSQTPEWINGHLIKMPEGDLTVSAEYKDTLYQLNLVGAVAVRANTTDNPQGSTIGGTSIENVKTVYEFAYGTTVTIKANMPSSSRLFVGWDQNFENNRVGEEGITEYTFEMTDEATTFTAVFSTISHNILPGANVDSSGASTSVFTGGGLTGVTAKKITAGVIEGQLSADPDLESLYGYSFSIPANTIGSSKTTENILKSDLNTVEALEPMTIKIVFKNRGDYPVTVELGYSYFGNVGSTGVVTVPAGEIVTKVFNSNIGLNDCSWAFSIRENVGGNEGEVVNLDVVAAAAQTYPTGYPLLKGSGDVSYMTFGGALSLKTGWKSGGRRSLFADKGAQLFVSRASNMSDDNASAYAKVTNLPEYDPENPTTTVYIQVLNLVNVVDNPLNKFTIMFSTSTDAFSKDVEPLASVEVNITEAGQVLLLKVEIPRSENEGTIYMHFVKTEKESGMEYNMFAQFAYNNAFGYVEED